MPIRPNAQPERDSGHRAGDLELHGWFMLGTGAQEVGLPKFGTHHPPRMPPGNPQMGAGELSADRDTKATPYGPPEPKEPRIGAISGEFPHSSISCDKAHGSDRPWPGT